MSLRSCGLRLLQQICAALEIPVSFLFEGALGSPPGEGGMPQDIIDFMESLEGAGLSRHSAGSPTARCDEASRGWSAGSLTTCHTRSRSDPSFRGAHSAQLNERHRNPDAAP